MVELKTEMKPEGFDENDEPYGEVEVLLCPHCDVYIHEDNERHRNAIFKHIGKKHPTEVV